MCTCTACINVLSAILLGPWYALIQAFLSSLIRNVLGMGTLFAFPGSMFGALLAGLLYKYKIIKNKLSICIFGGIAGYLYGFIVNLWIVSTQLNDITKERLMTIYISSIPFDTIHAVSTILFLFILAMPMKEKMERLKIKYGLFR